MIKAISKNIQLKIILYSLVVAIITLRDTDATLDPGLDGPFRWALNYFTSFDKKAFDQLQYTVGPLCFLKWPMPMGNHIFISTIFYLATGAVFVYLYTWFYSQFRDTTQLVVPLLTCAVLMMVMSIDILFLGCVLLAILYYKFLNQRGYINLALLLTVMGVYLKTSLFVSLFFIWVAFSIYLVMERQFKYLLQIILTGIVLFFLLGFLLFSSIGGIINFSVHSVLFAIKYSDLLGLYPYNSWVALGVCLCSLAIIIIFFFKQPGGFVMKIAALCLFSAWKYSMGREVFFPALCFLQVVILLMTLFLIVQRKNIHFGMFLFLTAICFYSFNLQFLPAYRDSYFWFPGIINFNERVIHAREFKQKMLDHSKQACATNLVPGDWRKTIGTHTVDIFPWDLSIIYINEFSFRSRPCLQSQRLAMENDAADASFLKSSGGPQYIIWHSTKGDKTNIDGLDDQYIPNTCPATMEAMLTSYKLTPMVNDRFSVWEKRPVPSSLEKQKSNPVTVAWGEWITLPPHDTNSMIKAYTDYKNTALYSIRSFLYKGLPVFIEYETDSGKVLQYSFSQQCAMEGLFLDPLWTDNQLHTVNIKRVRFINNKAQYFSNHLKVTLEMVKPVP